MYEGVDYNRLLGYTYHLRSYLIFWTLTFFIHICRIPAILTDITKNSKEKRERAFLCRRIIRFLKLVPDERRLECVLHGNFDIYKVFQSFFISVTIGGTGAAARYILLPQRREKKPMKTSPWTLPLLEKVSND